MGLMDKVKAQATQLAQQAQETAREGRARLDQAQANKRADVLLRNLGVLVYAEQTDRGTPQSQEQITALIAEISAHEAENGISLALQPTGWPAPGAPGGPAGADSPPPSGPAGPGSTPVADPPPPGFPPAGDSTYPPPSGPTTFPPPAGGTTFPESGSSTFPDPGPDATFGEPAPDSTFRDPDPGTSFPPEA
jgi:hypothetical protein